MLKEVPAEVADPFVDSEASTIVGSSPEIKFGFENRNSSHSTFGQTYSDNDYVIAELAKHDDIDLLPTWKRRLHRMAPLFTIAAVGAYFAYFGYRIYCTVSAQITYHKIYYMAWVFISAEFLVACRSSTNTNPSGQY